TRFLYYFSVYVIFSKNSFLLLTELPQAALFLKADAKVLLFHETAKLFYKKMWHKHKHFRKD
ncbi:MAG: hypothetical protein SOX54_10800, partial [Prevotella sp.]|nr:hypothetical protein [Prevotella sp.]MDY3272782.1 hypothetical protein [Prevotella sp.]